MLKSLETFAAVLAITQAPAPEIWSWHDKVAWGAGLALLVVGLITLWWFIIQTIATKKAAEAALLNAQAVINAERPWLIASVENDPQYFHFHQVQIKNVGRTPARFISGDATYVFAERADQLPVPPEYSSPIVLPDQLLVGPDKSFAIPHGYDVSGLLQRPEAANKTLVIYGRVFYGDTIIAHLHETRWCFGYTYNTRTGPGIAKGGFILGGPSEYTENT